MATTLADIFAGPANLWVAEFGAVEPAFDAAPGVGWTDAGATDGGLTIAVNQSYTPITVDQIAAELGALAENQSMSISTNLAQATLANWKAALNGGTITNVPAVVGPPAVGEYDEFEPIGDLVNDPLLYHACLVRGKTLDGRTGQFIARRVLNTANVESTFGKTSKAMLSTTFSCYYVSTSIAPFSIQIEAAAP